MKRTEVGVGLHDSFFAVVWLHCLYPPLHLAHVPAATVGGLQGHADGLGLLQQLQYYGLQDRLRDEVPGGELQLQNGPHAW